MSDNEIVVKVDDLVKTFSSRSGKEKVKAVRSVSLVVEKGRTLGLVGESGSGKSTFSNLIVNYIQKEYSTKILHLDGDVLREIFSNKNYSIDERKKISFQYSNLCKFLTIQNLNIVISTISICSSIRCSPSIL